MMNLELSVQAKTYDEVQVGLLAEAERFYEGRRFGFYNLTVKAAGDYYEASGNAYEVTPPRHQRTAKADVPEESWDPFANDNGYDPF